MLLFVKGDGMHFYIVHFDHVCHFEHMGKKYEYITKFFGSMPTRCLRGSNAIQVRKKKMNPFCHDIYVNHCSSTLRMNVKNVKQLSYKF